MLSIHPQIRLTKTCRVLISKMVDFTGGERLLSSRYHSFTGLSATSVVKVTCTLVSMKKKINSRFCIKLKKLTGHIVGEFEGTYVTGLKFVVSGLEDPLYETSLSSLSRRKPNFQVSSQKYSMLSMYKTLNFCVIIFL